jgi:hypothetical protein
LLLLVLLFAALYGSGQSPALIAQTATAQEIIYLDNLGYIRVLNANTNAISWVSPQGDWRDFTVGDFNSDGDDEIAAVGGTGATAKLAIYDPVVSKEADVDVDKTVNDIPWNTFFYTQGVNSPLLPGTPWAIAAGDLDPGTPGDELVYAVEVPNQVQRDLTSQHTQLIILHQTPTTTTVQSWHIQLRTPDFNNPWRQLAVGDIDNQGAMEILAISQTGEQLRVFRIEGQALTQIYANTSDSRPWAAGAIGQVFAGSYGEVAAVRHAPLDLPSLIVFRYATSPDSEGNYLKDEFVDRFNPSPSKVFLGDINRNDEQEVFMLRSVPANITNLPRLFMRNPGTDRPPTTFESVLDNDNGFAGGAAGDVDGDGLAEVVLIRNSKIRVYQSPENSGTASTGFADYSVSNITPTIKLGDLDKNGYIHLPKLVVQPAQLAVTLAAGSNSTQNFAVSNVGTQDVVSFTVRFAGGPSWLKATPSSSQTPATIAITVDAYGLPPLQSYASAIQIIAQHPRASREPVAVPVSLKTKAGLWPIPSVLTSIVDCTAITSTLKQENIVIGGLLGVTYEAVLNAEGAGPVEAAAPLKLMPDAVPQVEWPTNVAWVKKVTGISTILPTTITLTFDPAQRENDLQHAQLQITARNNQGVPHMISIPVNMGCGGVVAYLPTVYR